MHEGYDVEHIAAAHRVLHYMHLRTKPGRDVLRAQTQRKVGLAHQGAVGQVAGGAGRAVAQQPMAHGAPQAIGTHQGIAVDFVWLAASDRHARGALAEMLQGVVELQSGAGLLYGGVQQRQQIGPVQRGVGGCVALPHRAS